MRNGKKKKKSVPDLAKQNVRGSFLTNWSYQHPMPITSLFYGFINGYFRSNKEPFMKP